MHFHDFWIRLLVLAKVSNLDLKVHVFILMLDWRGIIFSSNWAWNTYSLKCLYFWSWQNKALLKYLGSWNQIIRDLTLEHSKGSTAGLGSSTGKQHWAAALSSSTVQQLLSWLVLQLDLLLLGRALGIGVWWSESRTGYKVQEIVLKLIKVRGGPGQLVIILRLLSLTVSSNGGCSAPGWLVF